MTSPPHLLAHGEGRASPAPGRAASGGRTGHLAEFCLNLATGSI